MKSIQNLIPVSIIVLAFSAQASQRVDFVVGPTFFSEGDSIELEDVRSSLGTLEVGDIVTIKGKYRLADKPQAKLLLTISQAETVGSQTVHPNQLSTLNFEEGTFELSIEIRNHGYLHLSLRTASGEDRTFGHVYFGTEEQMKAIAHWELSAVYAK